MQLVGVGRLHIEAVVETNAQKKQLKHIMGELSAGLSDNVYMCMICTKKIALYIHNCLVDFVHPRQAAFGNSHAQGALPASKSTTRGNDVVSTGERSRKKKRHARTKRQPKTFLVAKLSLSCQRSVYLEERERDLRPLSSYHKQDVPRNKNSRPW